MADTQDSVPIGGDDSPADSQPSKSSGSKSTIWNYVVLFFVALFAMSQFFIDHVLKKVSPDNVNSVSGEVSNTGHVITSAFLVMFYAVITQLSDCGIL